MNYGRKGIREKQQALNARGPKWARKFLLIIAEAVCIACIALVIFGSAMGIGVFKGILSTAPDITKISVNPSGRASFVYDSEGNQVSKLVSTNANRIIVSSDQISDTLKNAFVAIEDERFYNHNGIDIQGIIHAGVNAVMKGRLGAGASTITQQLIKNNVFTKWASEENDIEKVKRKIQEQYLAIQLEKNSTKDAILTTYLNTINLGANTLGVQTASLRYFNKNCSELTLSECAVIAGITQNPSKYNPITRPDDNKGRMKDVLYKMLELGYITEAEYKEALADDVYSRIQATNEITNENSTVTSYFVDALTEQLEDDLINAGYTSDQAYALLYSGGLKIHSTMDPTIQAICDEEFANPENYLGVDKWLLSYQLTVQKADESLENHSSEMFRSYYRQTRSKNFNMIYTDQDAAYEDIKEYTEHVLEEGDEIFAESVTLTPQPQVSFTVEDQKTGHVVAIIGGRGTKIASRTLNRATQSTRQPGSCFKVLASFAPAIDACGKTLASVYNDAPFNYYDGTPVANWYGEEYRGLENIRVGIYQSLNVVAVKTITEITPQLGYNYLLNFGFTTLEDAKYVGNQVYTDIGQPLALGGITNGVTNLELNAAYAAIANKGEYIQPVLYTYVEDSEGNVILDNRNPAKRQVISPQTAYLLTQAMRDTMTIGTASDARVPGMTIAGKTGTTSDERDVWLAGYSPYYTATVWAGFDNNEIMTAKEQKVTKTMFKNIMTRIHEDLPDIGFDVPSNIVQCAVCKKSGKLPTELCMATGCTRTEYFTEDTVPTEYCDVHYQGPVCAFDNLAASPGCPFAYDGIIEIPPVEAEALWQGSNVVASELDPLGAAAQAQATPARTSNYCHHNEAFFAQPGWEDIVNQERAYRDYLISLLAQPQP